MGSMKLYVFFTSSFLIHLVPLIVAQQSIFLEEVCISDGIANNTKSSTKSSTYLANLNSLLTSFSNTLVDNGFYSSSASNNTETVNAIGLSRPDLTPDACRSCMNTSGHALMKLCPKSKEAIIFYDTCILRYANRSIFGIRAGRPTHFGQTDRNLSDVNHANQVLLKLLHDLRSEAAKGGPVRKYAAGEALVNELETIYSLVQCTPDLQENDCIDCLDEFIGLVPLTSQGRTGGTIFGPSCNLRYDTSRFYGPLAASSPSPMANLPSLPQFKGTTRNEKNNNKRRVVLFLVVPSIILSLLIIPIWVFRKRPRKEKVENNEKTLSIESLLFTLGTIKAATDDFSEANKLGRGGFGDVFKGILSNGQEIAVKRLAMGSNQGDLEFKNEVLFLAKLQHKNLIKLQGFCLEGGEKLLIYELVPYSSLDHFIFDPPPSRACLDWEKRYRIIKGIARGLLYLHEDSHIRIIHRDLKASNILLDADMNPKISDFGLAKLFSLDQTHANTRKIAGTYGYMAPEYPYHGNFSVKSDVYSFGVMVLEILSGRKTSSQNGEELEHLVGYAWRKWSQGTILDLVDPALRVNSTGEIMRCFQIGLLCVQESVASRPTMPLIVSMLDSNHRLLPIPSRPGFLLHITTQRVEDNSEISGSNYSQRRNSAQSSVNEVSISELYPR